MLVFNLSGKALPEQYASMDVSNDVMDEVHEAIQTGNVGRLQNFMDRCKVEKLIFSTEEDVPSTVQELGLYEVLDGE